MPETSKLRVLDLFSGISTGGFSLGLERTGGFKTVAFCEIDPYCRRVLAKHWPGVPIHDDITTRDFTEGEADVITAGFPCQDLSYAGRGAGLSGERSGLYRHVIRAIRLVRPAYTLMENVAALLNRGMGRVLGDVAEAGLDAEWDCISGRDVGAPHGRDRLWIAIADPDKFQRQIGRGSGLGWWLWRAQEIAAARDTNGSWKLQPPRLLGEIRRRIDYSTRSRAWWPRDWQAQFEALRRMDDGIPTRLDRSRDAAAISKLGNAVITVVPEILGQAILKSMEAVDG
jgi:DNA (cytosine-5)-methyltransferase 1